MLVIYGTLHVPFSPGTRPKLTVPSASRGVGGAGACAPRPPARPPPPPPCRAPPWPAAPPAAGAPPPCGACACTHTVDANTAAAVAPRSAVRRLFLTNSPLRGLRGNAGARSCEQPLTGRRHQNGGGVARRAAVLRQAALHGHLVT